MRWRIVGGLALLVAGGIAAVVLSIGAGPSVSSRVRMTADKALRAWRAFPVERSPRALIMLPSYPVVDLPVDARDGQAFGSGRYVLDARLPAIPERHAGYALQSAQASYQTLLAYNRPDGKHRALVRVTRIVLGQATFITDRGNQRLPAWRFFASGVHHPASVLAVRPYPLPPRPQLGMPSSALVDGDVDFAQVSAHGTRLKLTFFGSHAGTGPCEADYDATAFESATAVAYVVRQVPAKHPARVAVCDLMPYARSVTLRLRRPLGARVLIDTANAVPTQTAAQPPSIPLITR